MTSRVLVSSDSWGQQGALVAAAVVVAAPVRPLLEVEHAVPDSQQTTKNDLNEKKDLLQQKKLISELEQPSFSQGCCWLHDLLLDLEVACSESQYVNAILAEDKEHLSSNRIRSTNEILGASNKTVTSIEMSQSTDILPQ